MLTRMQIGVYLAIDIGGGGGIGLGVSLGCVHSCSRMLGVLNSNSNLPQGVSTHIYSYITMYLKLAMSCHFKVIMDRHTHTQTDRQTTSKQ